MTLIFPKRVLYEGLCRDLTVLEYVIGLKVIKYEISSTQ